jgi:hypothetical protein
MDVLTVTSCAAWNCCRLQETVSDLLIVLEEHRWRVYLEPRCLHLGLWSRCQYQSTLQRPVSRWHLAELNTMQHLTAWFGSELLFLSFLHCGFMSISCLLLSKHSTFEVDWVFCICNWWVCSKMWYSISMVLYNVEVFHTFGFFSDQANDFSSLLWITNVQMPCHADLMCRVRKFPGQTELTMSAEVELISTMVEKKSWTRPPIQMEFQVSSLLKHFAHAPHVYWVAFFCIFGR